MNLLKWSWLVIFLLLAAYSLLVSMSTGAMSVIDGPAAAQTSLIEFVASLVCLNIALTGYLIFDRAGKKGI